MQQRLPSILDEPITFGHRGARAHAPENTIESFRLALRLGASGLESDVWLTADGVPVLDHDGVVRRGVMRRRPIGEIVRRDLPPHIPSLADVIDALGSAFHLSLDLKDPAAGGPVIDVVREAAPALLERTWLCHSDHDLLMSLRGRGPRLVDSTRLVRIKEGPERRAAALQRSGIDAVNLHHTDWNGGLVTLFHRFDRVAFGWDLQEPRLLEASLRMGLDGVFSDHPDRMVDAYRTQIGSMPTPPA